jgi:prepilin-type N-terminal cleavage/methylation domain-containing protein
VNRQQRGFTLIELLISVVILAGLMAILFGALHLGARVVARQSGQLDRATQVALVQNFLRNQLADAQPVLAAGAQTVDFDGRSDGVGFVSPAAESVDFGGLQVLGVQFIAGSQAAAGRLLLRWRRYRDSADGAAEDHDTLLLDELRQAHFEYYGPAPQNPAPAWQESWQAQPYLPLLVRVSAVFADGETMPDLTIALRLATSAVEQGEQHQGRF